MIFLTVNILMFIFLTFCADSFSIILDKKYLSFKINLHVHVYANIVKCV